MWHMDLSPQAVAAATFRTVKRGYDPDEVRAYLIEVSASLEASHQQATAMEARARAAIQRLQDATQHTPAPPPITGQVPVTPTTDEAQTISRTLLLAQRTADTTIAEAQAEAASITGSAQAEATRVTEDAAASAAKLLAEAEAEAGRLTTTARTEAERITADANGRAASTRRAAEQESSTALEQARAEAARVLDEARAEAHRAKSEQHLRAEAEVADLQRRREALLADVDGLEQLSARHRSTLRDLSARLGELAELVPASIDRPVLRAELEPAAGEPAPVAASNNGTAAAAAWEELTAPESTADATGDSASASTEASAEGSTDPTPADGTPVDAAIAAGAADDTGGQRLVAPPITGQVPLITGQVPLQPGVEPLVSPRPTSADEVRSMWQQAEQAERDNAQAHEPELIDATPVQGIDLNAATPSDGDAR